MTEHIIGILALLLSIAAAIGCARLLGNWRHPIMILAIMSACMVPAIVVHDRTAQAAKVSPPKAKVDVMDLVRARYQEMCCERQAKNSE